MLRKQLMEKRVGVDADFHWRGHDVSRIEGISDGVFAFSVTLLVVSLEVPKTFDDLLVVMRGFAAFAICFLMLMQVWFWHYRFFRRYGLQDNAVVWLNALLLFVVLAYIYPLKFLFTLGVNELLGLDLQVKGADGRLVEPIKDAQFPTLMIIYSAGFMAVTLIFVLLYFQAYRKREDLQLNLFERFDTVETIQTYFLLAAVALFSIMLALFGQAAWAGFAYFLIAPVRGIFGTIMGKRRRELETQIDTDERPSFNAE